MARLDPHPDRPPRRVDIPRHDMVRWLSPITLARAGLEIGVSWVFGTFADKREIQAGLPPPRASYANDAEPDGSFWIDFVSDAGDGFDAAYTVAWLLAQPGLVLSHDGAGHATRRGRLLIHGGDQVYPAAGWKRYQERFVLPYRAALPFVPDEDHAPHLFAVPGNHDWYDGLTSFMRLFCQERWIGGWRTRQSRSYFALQLPHDWWLWAIDVQLDTYIDEPQLDFFEQVARAAFAHGGKVILVTSKPSWVRAGERPRPRSWETLAFFEEQVIGWGGEVALTLAGDIHHYCHYRGPESSRPAHRVTSGAGGASLSSTHAMPPTLELTGHGADSPERFERVATFPEVGESERLARGVLRLLNPLYGPTQGMLIGAIYALFALVLANGLKDRDGSVLDSFDGRGPLALLGDALTSWFGLLAALLALLLIADADVRADSPGARKRKRFRYGLVHWLIHLASLTAATLLTLWALTGWGFAEQGFRAGYLAALALFALGWLWGRSMLALYWYGANRSDARQHATQVFAAQAIEDYKGFLRLRIGSDGRLTVFPVGVRRAVKDWRLKPPTDDEDALLEPWFEPASGREPQPELIEAPFTAR